MILLLHQSIYKQGRIKGRPIVGLRLFSREVPYNSPSLLSATLYIMSLAKEMNCFS